MNILYLHASFVLYYMVSRSYVYAQAAPIPMFYMYNLGPEYFWRWPDRSVNCSASSSDYYIGNRGATYSGIGEPVDLSVGYFDTWQGSMFNSIYNRLVRSHKRTYDPDKASLFVIPYDAALDGMVNQATCNRHKTCDFQLVTQLEKQLLQSKYFLKYNGTDHLILWSLGAMQFHPKHCFHFIKNFCANCIKTAFWMSTAFESNYISVPYPSSYHWHEGIVQVPWRLNQTRRFTASYIGSIKTETPPHSKVRKRMVDDCLAHSQHCTWVQIGHTSQDKTLVGILSVYRQSVFCLCPPGDDPSRKALFDSLLSGCIPVIFHPATLYNQYPWHFLSEEEAVEISVNIPYPNGKPLKSVIQYLLSIPKDEVLRKQTLIEKLAPKLQYSAPPLVNLKNIHDQTRWDPPFPDAADMILDGISRRLAVTLSGGKDILRKTPEKYYELVERFGEPLYNEKQYRVHQKKLQQKSSAGTKKV